MILATYQPINDNKALQQWNEIEKYLGYRPIFCFAANTPQELIVNSILVAPNCSEKLVIFEAEDYVELDTVQYNKKIAAEYQNKTNNTRHNILTIQDCFTNKSIMYKEFIVSKISGVIAEINIFDAFFMRGKTENENYQEEIDGLVSTITEKAIDFLKECGNIDIEKIECVQDLSFGEKKILKEVFQLYLLPLISQNLFKDTLNNMIIFDKETYFGTTLQNDLSRFYNPESDMKYKTYGFYDKLVLGLKRCASYTLEQLTIDNMKKEKREVPLNAPCPCGSGKKYKRCCGKNYK